MISHFSSLARSAAAESVVKNGLPVPAAQMTMRCFSRWRMARRRMNGSATSGMVIADVTRVYAPRRSRASCSASALITVASMPMWSPATRSIPSVAAVTPRKMLPPPMTMAISTPIFCTPQISSAMSERVPGSMPVRRSLMSASPERLRRTRLYLGRPASVMARTLPCRATASGARFAPLPGGADSVRPRTASLHVRGNFRGEIVALLLDALAELVAHEARHRVLAAGVLVLGLHVVADGLLVVADVRLLEQAGLAVELLHLAGHHLLDDILRLAGLGGLIAGDLALRVEVLLRHLAAVDEARLERGDVHGHVARDLGGLVAGLVRHELHH